MDGGKTYKLHLPPGIPAKQFWSLVLYDTQTRSMLQTDQQFPSIGSQKKGVAINPDTSVDVYFGPTAPSGKESNWVQTWPGKGWSRAHSAARCGLTTRAGSRASGSPFWPIAAQRSSRPAFLKRRVDGFLGEERLHILIRHARGGERVAPRRGVVLLDHEMLQPRQRGVRNHRLEVDVADADRHERHAADARVGTE